MNLLLTLLGSVPFRNTQTHAERNRMDAPLTILGRLLQVNISEPAQTRLLPYYQENALESAVKRRRKCYDKPARTRAHPALTTSDR